MERPTPNTSESTDGHTIIIDTLEGLAMYTLLVRRAALKLELKGLKRSGGRRTAYSICKEVYHLRGSRQSVLNQLNALVESRMPPKNAT